MNQSREAHHTGCHQPTVDPNLMGERDEVFTTVQSA